MLCEDNLRPAGTTKLGKGGVEERRVLVSVYDFELPLPDLDRQSMGNSYVEPGPTIECDDRDAFSLEDLAKLPDAIETEDDRIDPLAETANGFGNQHFRPGHLHHMQHESDADGRCAVSAHDLKG